jgi:O-methyltransferase/aklanonic acid methyltransferase
MSEQPMMNAEGMEWDRVFSAAAASYDEVIPFFAYWGESTIARLPLELGDRILDVASGRGSTIFPALDRVGPGGHVVGTDFAPDMVRLTREEIGRSGIPNAEILEMDARNLDFPDESFDAVVCAFAIFLVPSPETALAEMRRVVKPGGHVMLATWSGDDPRYAWMGPAVGAILGAAAGRPADPFQAEGSLPAALEAADLAVQSVEDEEHTFYFRDAGQWIEWQASQGARRLIERLESKAADAVARFHDAAVRETEKYREPEGIPMSYRARFTLAKRTA